MRLALAIGIGVAACGAPPPAIIACHPATPTPIAAYDLGTLHVTGAPPVDRAIRADLERYAAIPSARLLDISADGTRLLVQQGGDAQLLAQPLAAGVAVSSGVDVAWAAFGDADAIDVAGDHDGTEDDRLYRVTVGTVKQLGANHRIADPIERHGRLVWAEPEAESTAIWLLDRGAPKQVFTGDGAWAVIDLSLDGTQLLARKTVSLESSTLYRISTSDGHAVALTSVDPRVAAPGAQFGATGEVFAIASAGDRLNVWQLMARGQRLIAPELDWDVAELAVAPDGATIAFTTNEDGASVLYLYDTVAHTHRIAPDAPTGGVISDLRFADHAAVLAFSFSDAHHPRAAVTYDLAAERATAWTHSDTTALGALASPSHVMIDAIPALVIRPKPTTSGRAPVIVELHGGPEDQWLPKWAPFEQALVARGFAVVQPNVHGSVGYGQAYAAADDGPARAIAVHDVGRVLAWIAAQPDLDPQHVAVMGTSYGGYLALSALIAYPDQLRAGIDIVGIADLVAFLEGTAPYRQASRRTEYGDERDPNMRAQLAALSPIGRAAAIKAPLLVAQGQRDPRVPPAVSDHLVAAVRAAGGTVWSLAAADEGHGFTQPDHVAALQALIVQLLYFE